MIMVEAISETSPSDVKLLRVIGKGGFADVYLGTVRGKLPRRGRIEYQ